jgi:hypothetical protein
MDIYASVPLVTGHVSDSLIILFWELFAFRRLMRFSKPYPSATTVLVNEFDAGCLQGTPNRQIVSSRHRRLAVGQLGPADGGDA